MKRHGRISSLWALGLALLAIDADAQQFELKDQQGLPSGLPQNLTIIGMGEGAQVVGDLKGFNYEVLRADSDSLYLKLVSTDVGWDCLLRFNTTDSQQLKGSFSWLPHGAAMSSEGMKGTLSYAALIWCCSNHAVSHCGTSDELKALSKSGCSEFSRPH